MGTPGRGLRLGAALVLRAVAVSLFHVAFLHHVASRDCSACQAFHTPSLADGATGPAAPAPQDSPLIAESAHCPASARVLQLPDLRAPPGSSIL